MAGRTLSELTIVEIDHGNSRLPDDGDLETALVKGGRHRWAAMAVLAWLHDRRDNPDASLDHWRGQTPDQLLDYLGDQEPPEDAQEGPTEPAP